jgi:hypothetical protein
VRDLASPVTSPIWQEWGVLAVVSLAFVGLKRDEKAGDICYIH